MTDRYMRELLRISVAQICQTIGYHVIQATPFELLQDILHKFLHEIARDLHRQVEHYERTEANLNDIYITLSNLNVNITELSDYANNVEPVPLSVEVPKFPAHKNTNLNFLKPGSKEVLIRPVHIYEYLPPILPADPQSSLPSHYLHSDSAFVRSGSINAAIECPTRLERGRSNTLTAAHNMNRLGEPKDTPELSPEGAKVTLSSSHMFDEEGRPTREISSVVMTTGGFISPAIEGKLPDTKVPKFVEKLMGLDAPPPVSPPAELSSENSRSTQYKPHTSNATIKMPVAAFPFLSPKTLLSAENPEVTDTASSRQPLPLTSKDSVGIQNASDITNLNTTNKFGLGPLTSQMPMPTIATKLLNKSKKKNLSNLHGALPTKPYLTNTESYGTAVTPSLVESPDKGNRKNKKMLHKLLKPGMETSSHSSDSCNSVIQRHKMEKYLKKQSKLEKKLLHKQKHNEVKKKSPPLDLPSSLGGKLPAPLPMFSNNNNTKALSDLPLIKDSALPDVSKEKTCLPNPGLSDFAASTFAQSCITDNSFGIIDSGSVIDNTQLSPSDKKPLSGAKLSAELDRNKLNIFKKISKQKSQKPSSPNSSNLSSPQMCMGNDGQFINLPCGTTITPSPPSLKSLIPTDASIQNSELIEKKSKMLVNNELGGALGLLGNSPSNNLLRVPNELSPQSLHFNDPTKPKKRGRKPGSKNLPKQTFASPNGESDMKKMKKLKASKYEQQQPLHLDTRNVVDNRMELSNPSDNLVKTLDRGEDVITSCVSANMKDNRKEKKKGKLKNMPISEKNLFSADAVIPTKEEVNTINKKLLRMDTILQPLGGFNEAMMDPNTDIVHTFPHNTLPYKSPTNRKRPSPQSLQLQTTPNLMHGAHQPFMSKPVMGGIPDLLKLCPFPPGPGLIPPTAQNLLFPRLPPTFQLPIPNMKPPPNAAKSLNAESPINNTSSLDPPLLKDDLCDVPQFVTESMTHPALLAIPEMRNAETEFLNSFNFHYLSTFCEKLIETPELWAPIENIPIPTSPGYMSLNTDEFQMQNECFNNSQKTVTENPLLGDASPTLNLDEILELFDESHELPPWLLNSSNSPNQSELDQCQNDLTATLMNFFQMEDIIPTFNETKQATELSTSGSSLESTPLQVGGERSYCNVPPFVPESMKLASPDVISEMKKSERDCPKTPKIHHSTAVGEKILKTPDHWSTPETISKSIPPTPGGMSLNTYELHLQNERTEKSNTDNAEFIGGTYSQHKALNTVLAKTSAATTILNTDDPIELSDDSIEYTTTALNTTHKDLHHNQAQITMSHKFSLMEDYVPIRKDITKNSSGDLYLSSKDKKNFQKANKLVKNATNFFPTPTENVPQIDMFSSEKRGVGKLAGGADLIPLISTGSAYSSKTIPSTSLTATVASPFALAKKDIYSTNAFESSLMPTNLSGNEFLSVNNELQRKKKDHKKLKKLKEEKAKKKKDKKSKCKERTEHHEKLLHKTEKMHKEIPKDPTLRDEEQQQLVNKDLLKRLKKEKKKKYKQLFTEDSEHASMKPATAIDSAGIRGMGKPSTLFSMFNTATNLPSAASLSSSTPSFVPKLTLKLGSSQSPTPVEDATHKNYFSTSTNSLNEFERKREPSPELARISPLVTRPAKQKISIAETLTSSLNANTPSIGNVTFDAVNENNVNAISAPKTPCVSSSVPPPSPWSSGGTISASSVLLPQQLLQPLKAQEHLGLSGKLDGGLLANSLITTSRSMDATARHSPVPLISETSRPSSYIDAEGNRVWICPACGKVDDGSPMIGCDGCDAWYHWICVGITIAPKDNEDWFCRVCITRKKGVHVTDKKRKRSKKK
ncbi:uncharacterized protein LOC105220279 isoform X2 [Zeugodacus cucurbitae]|uniref:uncharacterized protein LOC105220279 isoform X2 n=1 Tax=Zeugodacus cucurbitae TaxID=28588 RepID=UPI0023D90911|nr:uncharacterized protein LOC105220279 isoform X2 [Zeugodacus cucurbitae]